MSERVVAGATPLQRAAADIRRVPAAQLDAAPPALQDALITVLRAASQELAATPQSGSAAQPSSPVHPDDAEKADRVAAAGSADHSATRAVRAVINEWSEAPASVRLSVEAGTLPSFPTAGEYRRWSDERIAAGRLEPEEWPDDPPLEAHPFDRAIERVEEVQRDLRRAESTRVMAALSAWRVAVETRLDQPDAGRDPLFRQAVMMQLAYSLQVAEQTASAMVTTAEHLEAGLPRTWARFVAGEVPWRGMQQAHAAMVGLDRGVLPQFDEKVAETIVTVAMPRLKRRLHDIRERLQASTAVDRHRVALAARHVEFEPLPDGMVACTNLMPAAEALFLQQGLREQAVAAVDRPGETRGIAQIESDLLTDAWVQSLQTDAIDHPDITVPSRRAVSARVGVLIPAMTAMGHSEAPPILEGYGPIDLETAKRLAGTATSWIKVLTDPITGAVLTIGREKYRPSADMRALLGILDGGGRGPNSTAPPSRTEADHVTPFRQRFARGETALHNLVLLAHRHHRIKTAGYWDIELRDGRTLAWTSFAGTRIITTIEPLEPTPAPVAAMAAPDGDPPF